MKKIKSLKEAKQYLENYEKVILQVSTKRCSPCRKQKSEITSFCKTQNNIACLEIKDQNIDRRHYGSLFPIVQVFKNQKKIFFKDSKQHKKTDKLIGYRKNIRSILNQIF